MNTLEPGYWRKKSLQDMTFQEWEALCDGCGKCGLIKLEDEDTQELAFTRVACKLLNTHTCGCTRYRERHRIVPGCVQLSPGKVDDLDWLPASCAYVRVSRGQPLKDWHPLVSGDPKSVHRACASIRGWCVICRCAGYCWPTTHAILG